MKRPHPTTDPAFSGQPLTKVDIAYSHLRQRILEGELAPGETLDQEELAASMNLSTTPVREALRRLESERLVVSRAHRNTTVAPLSAELLEHVYSVRLSLDPLAAAEAARKAGDPELRAIATTTAKETPQDRSPLAYLHANRRLHSAIYRACGNPILVNTLDSLWDMSDRYRMVTLNKDDVLDTASNEHHAIVDAVVTRDADRAGTLMYQHVAESFERIHASLHESEQVTD